MISCCLALGSNQKNPERQLRQAIAEIRCLPKTNVDKISNLHWSKAWGNRSQQDFCNAVLLIHTDLTPNLLLAHCKKIESKHERVRKKRWGPRTLDIDIILYGNRRINSRHLTIPHPYFLDREFVLAPLFEIKPELINKYGSKLSIETQ